MAASENGLFFVHKFKSIYTEYTIEMIVPEGCLTRVAANKQAKWDEMNILATFHPADKDYGHIKIDEPPTPYNAMEDDEMEEGSGDEKAIDPHNLADRLSGQTEPKVLSVPDAEDEEESSEEEINETPEEKAKRLSFEQKRKMHYNEFQAVKLARQLVDDDEDEDEVEENSSHETEGSST